MAAKPPSRQDGGWDGREPDETSDRLAGAVLDAALEVHRHLGPAFAESIYENALCHELTDRGVTFDRQVRVAVRYKGQLVGEGRADLLGRLKKGCRRVVLTERFPKPLGGVAAWRLPPKGS